MRGGFVVFVVADNIAIEGKDLNMPSNQASTSCRVNSLTSNQLPHRLWFSFLLPYAIAH
ncbi:hypothetical protein ASPFODRAFT_48387, partial [Aspergillus luchuensis CBS 106.47]